MWDSKSGLTFLQRIGIFSAPANPAPRLSPGSLKVHNLPLAAPYPDLRFLADREGDPPPDRVEVITWSQPE